MVMTMVITMVITTVITMVIPETPPLCFGSKILFFQVFVTTELQFQFEFTILGLYIQIFEDESIPHHYRLSNV